MLSAGISLWENHQMPIRFVLVVVAMLSTSIAKAAEDVTTFTLENGMQAVVIEDHRTPAVVHMVWYRAGAADEPAGSSGIAHFLEHLLFKATDTMESGEFSRVVEANGGTDNAFTSWDYTAYFQRVAADRLSLMMQMEADRMVNLRLTEDEILTERSVILEERAQRTDSDPGSLFSEQMRAALFLNHPYRIPIIGWRHEMETLSRDDALEFYQRYYAPDNAILVVAGDVTPDEVRALAQEHYGPLEPSGFSGPRVRPTDPPHLADRRLVFEDPRVSNPYVMRYYPAPERDSGRQQDAAALSMLAELLGGNGTTSVFGRRLQLEEERSLFTAAYYSALSLDDTIFTLINVPVPGVTLEQAEADLDRLIAEFLETGVEPGHFARIKTQIAASEIYRQDDVQSLARAYGSALTTGLTVEDVAAWPQVLADVTEEQVMQAARLIFENTYSVTGYLTAPATVPQEATQ
jgi:zinc protease